MKSLTKPEAKKPIRVNTDAIQCFTEAPHKTEKELPVGKLGAFDLFNIFTADVIRSKKKFTR
jgi:hypothetical protein